MCRTLRDQTFLLVPLVACFLGRLAALTQIQDDAHHIRISDSSDGLDIPLPSAASENRDLAQHKQTAASLVASWGLTAPLALAQLAGTALTAVNLSASHMGNNGIYTHQIQHFCRTICKHQTTTCFVHTLHVCSGHSPRWSTTCEVRGRRSSAFTLQQQA